MRRAFTLIELVIACGIVGLLLGAAVVSWRSGRSGADTRGLAEAVAQLLRTAQAQALSGHVPVAVALPTSGSPYAQALVFFEGESQARVKRVFNFAGEHPGAVIFHGQWPLDPAGLRDPASTNQVGAPLIGGRADGWNPSTWLSGRPEPALVFTPSGQVVGHNMTYFDQDYHLVVSEGVACSGTQLQSVHRAYTVSVSPTGGISVGPGVLAGTSVAEAPGGLPMAMAAPPLLNPAGANQSPVIANIRLHPHADPASLPPGCDALLAGEDHLSIEVEANDPDGDALQVSWTCPASEGVFSCTGSEPMKWDPVRLLWTSSITWRPRNPAAAVGTRYQLECRVEDQRGGVALSSQVGQRTVAVGETRPLIFVRFEGLGGGSGYTYTWGGSSYLPPGAQPRLYRANLDGSGERCITDKAIFPEMASLSPDGKRVAYVEIGRTPWTLHVANLDGSDDFAVLPGVLVPSPADFSLAWSPDSAHLAVTDGAPADNSRGERLLIVNAETSNINSAVAYTSATPGNLTRLPAWSPDASKLIFCANRDSWLYQIYQIDLSQPLPQQNPLRLTNSPTWDTRPAFSPDGTHIAFGFGDGQWNIGMIKADGSDRHTMFTSADHSAKSGLWSPDGKFLCCRDDANIWVIPVDANYQPGTPVQVTNNPPYFGNRCYAMSWTAINQSASPDDNRVVWGQESGGFYSLFSVRPDGSQLTRVTHTPGVHDLPNGLVGPQHLWW